MKMCYSNDDASSFHCCFICPCWENFASWVSICSLSLELSGLMGSVNYCVATASSRYFDVNAR
jgi:hypothetical protein